MLRRNTAKRANWKDAENSGIRETLGIGFTMSGALP
jgi:hypothetical protein